MQPQHWYTLVLSLLLSLGQTSIVLTQSDIPGLVKVGLVLGGLIALATTIKAMLMVPPGAKS